MGLLQSLLAKKNSPANGTLCEDVTSHAMRAAVEKWYRLYYDNEVREDYDPSARLAYTVVSRLVRTVFHEYRSEQSGSGEAADGLRLALTRLDAVRAEAMMHCLIGGECLLKPVVAGHGLDFVVVRRPAYRVLGRNEQGRAMGYATVETSRQSGRVYTLLEKRRLQNDGRCEVESRLYQSREGLGTGAEGWPLGGLGTEVPLATLAKYAHLPQRCVLELGGLGLVELRTPVANCVDGSADGVSVYAAATGLIENSAKLEAALNKEFANAASRIVASRDMLRDGPNGEKRLEEDLFIALDDDPASVGITVYSPAIRDESFLRRKNDMLRSIENVIGLNRGILSEAEAVQRTATEISTSEGEYNLTVQQLQEAWKSAAIRVMGVCKALGAALLGWGETAQSLPAPVLDFGDGVLFNRTVAWQEYERMVHSGWLKPEVALAWYFGIDEGDGEALRRMMPDKGKEERKDG